MKIKPFKLERFFAEHEFTAPFNMCASDCEPLTMAELLDMADKASLKLWANLGLGYTEPQGHRLLREEISRLYKNISPEQVLVTAPEEGILVAMTTILERGDHVIVTYPAYQSLFEIARFLGREVSEWLPREHKGWSFDINDLVSLINPRTKLIIINFPHNPTGATITRSDLAKIAEIAGRKDIVLFSDEMYRFLEYDERDRLPAACDMSRTAVSLSGLSKSFALAGLRIGWLATQDGGLFKGFAGYKDYTTICSSAPSELLAIMALRARDRILKRNLELVGANLERLDGFFAEHPDLFDWRRPKGGTVGFPRLQGETKSSQFCADVREKKGVLLLPAEAYGFEGNNFRVGFGRRNMPEAMEKLRAYVNQYMR
ncbi:MAG: aminotransferase class I/II-fold pyridoxal phosphate-dependent enzyme [Candidatus Aminicenantes bacterium]|nr:aminotransferase class I/II-fold pyridoxal phosphate-dependent enzyme [Candidatus Aminicenantes bacterium]